MSTRAHKSSVNLQFQQTTKKLSRTKKKELFLAFSFQKIHNLYSSTDAKRRCNIHTFKRFKKQTKKRRTHITEDAHRSCKTVIQIELNELKL